MRSVVILGGGTAGWMAATLMSAAWKDRGIGVTLIESPDIGIIGVGEGSTPQLRAFFDRIGIRESDWMPACNATYKLGIRFQGWSEKPGFASYFHPFPALTDTHSGRPFVRHCFERRSGSDMPAHPDDWFLNTALSAQRRGPAPDYRFPFPVQYGYHFDSHLLGQRLSRHAVSGGVKHRLGRVESVVRSETGDISALVLDDGARIEGDLFVDCSGFAGVLIQKTLGVPFQDFSANLFNDAAVVFPTAPDATLTPETVSVAMRNGWRWRIPLTNRVGNGYVYSSSYCSADEAETELRRELGLLDSPDQARHLKMRVGQVKEHWSHNCLAVGLSQGFIEPLEATALHLVQVSIERFIEQFEAGGFTARNRDAYNDQIRRRFEGIRDYIVCHYRVNSRTDSDYWRDNARNENLSTSLRRILAAWLGRRDLTVELQEQGIEKYYTTLSWHCLLAGYGIFPDPATLASDSKGAGAAQLAETRDFLSRCALNFSPIEEQLDALREIPAA